MRSREYDLEALGTGPYANIFPLGIATVTSNPPYDLVLIDNIQITL